MDDSRPPTAAEVTMRKPIFRRRPRAHPQPPPGRFARGSRPERLAQRNQVRHQFVRHRQGPRIRLERTLRDDQIHELLGKIDVRLLQGTRPDGPEIPCIGRRKNRGPRLHRLHELTRTHLREPLDVAKMASAIFASVFVTPPPRAIARATKPKPINSPSIVPRSIRPKIPRASTGECRRVAYRTYRTSG